MMLLFNFRNSVLKKAVSDAWDRKIKDVMDRVHPEDGPITFSEKTTSVFDHHEHIAKKMYTYDQGTMPDDSPPEEEDDNLLAPA